MNEQRRCHRVKLVFLCIPLFARALQNLAHQKECSKPLQPGNRMTNLLLKEHWGASPTGTPEVSQEILNNSLVAAHEIAMAANVPYFYLHSSALGIFRDGIPPEHDDDVDLAVPWEDIG